MKNIILPKFVFPLACVALMAFSAPLFGQNQRGFGPYGEWLVKGEINGRPTESILAFTRGQQGGLTGQWISFWGLTELEDVQFNDGQLTFKQVFKVPNGDTMTSNFKGTIANRELSGTVSSDRGEYNVSGERRPRMSRAVGDWDMTVKMGEREYASKLIIRPGSGNALKAEWQSQRGEHKITDVEMDRNTLRFKRTSKFQENEWVSEFEGNLQRDTLVGAFKSERGEARAEGKRVGAEAIGDWMLDLTSDRGTRKQRLRVNPDLTGLYGVTEVGKVRLDGEQVSFDVVMKFGDQSFESKFAGKITDSKLEGELTSDRGTTKVSGTKVQRAVRSRTL